ncbi:MAG: glucose/mannose-6-phosphate isomerase [Crocinitomicaceae bacterium]|jgi:glucose/mannose-6-phosphate isomerase
MSMNSLIAAFPNNITQALEIASNVKITPSTKEIKNILICGMGGSGIGGKLVAKWVEDELKVPVAFTNDYNIPGFVSENTLVIGSSYSGNTEETLSSVSAAVERGARLIGICSGGKMLELCEAGGFDAIVVPGGNPPRTALAFSIVQLLKIFSELNLSSADRLTEIEKGRQLIVSNESEIKERATELATFLKGNVGVFYGTTDYEPVLVRARQQFNENGKMLNWHHTLPEMNHNELVGWGGGDERFATVFFQTDDIHRRNKKRLDITREAISKKTSKIHTVLAKGESRIERSLYFINIVDWASLYLAEMKQVDPIDIEIIDYLKDSLSNFK